MIKSKFPMASFSELFKRIDPQLIVEEEKEYNCLGVRLEGQGAYIREQRTGVEIKRKQQWLVPDNVLVYNKLFAWRGSFAITDDTVSGAIASDKFPMYEIDINKVTPKFLAYWLRTKHLSLQAKLLSKGAAALSKLTLNPPEFWKLWMPLPDLETQKRVTAKLDRIYSSMKIIKNMRSPIDAVVQGRRAGIGSEVRLLMTAALEKMNQAFSSNLGILDDVLTLRPRSGPSFLCADDWPGTAIVMPSALGGYRYDTSKVSFGDGSEIIKDADILRPGDLLISRGNKRDQVGLCIVYPDGCEETRTYANLLMRMRVTDGICPDFVKYWIMSPLSVRYIRKHTKGTSPSVQKINQQALINMPFPKALNKKIQAYWVAHLDSIFDQADKLEGMIREQYADISIFPDALLTTAFKGEL